MSRPRGQRLVRAQGSRRVGWLIRGAASLGLSGLVGVGLLIHVGGSEARHPVLDSATQPVSAANPLGRADWLASLPVARYLPTNADIANAQQATDVLTARCMRGFGFSWTPPKEPTADQFAILNSRRYGVTSMRDAAQYGYGLPFATPARASAPAVTDQQELLALTGSPVDRQGRPMSVAVVDGKQVPDGGCLGQARQSISGSSVDFGKAPVADQISQQSFVQSLHDSRLVAGFQAWSNCMAARGYHYANPLKAAADARWTSPPSSLERATATADITCAVASGVDTTWHEVETGIQNRLISEADGEVLKSEELMVSTLRTKSVAELHAAGVTPQ